MTNTLFMKILKDHSLILLLLFGLAIRIILTPIAGFKFDVDTWYAWAERLNSVGFVNFYSSQVWTGYPPGFLYILYILGFIKKIALINPSQFYIILKLPSILSEIALAATIYYIIPNNFLRWRRIALLSIILNPAFIFNSAIFGQFDGLFSLALLLSIYFLVNKKVKSASFLWGISFLLKPQAIILSPVFLFYIINHFSVKTFGKILSPFSLTILFAFVPFFPFNPIGGPLHLVTNLLDFYPYNSIFAYNFWGILGFWVHDNYTFFNVSYQNWGYILFMFFLSIIGYLYFWRKNRFSFFDLATLSSLGFFFLITRMHERYLYPSLVFLILISALKRSRLLFMLTILLSLIHLLDLYYVYIYYQLFLKLPPTIYISFIYNFAQNNIQLLSLFSTLIFVFTATNILLLKNESTKN